MKKLKQVYQFCFRCGQGNLTFAMPNSFRCINCDLRFYVNSSASVAAIIKNDKNEILLTKRKYPPAKDTWDIPGGFVNLLETAEDTVKREILEELNLNVCKVNYLFSYPNEYVYYGFTVYTLDLVYNCQVTSFKNIKIREDVSDYMFKNIHNIDVNSIGLYSMKKVIQKLKKSPYE